MIKEDGTVVHFNNPKVQASLAANTFAVTGHAENKQVGDTFIIMFFSFSHITLVQSNIPLCHLSLEHIFNGSSNVF